MDAALLPIKHLDEAKQRLGGALAARRGDIARALVLDALERCGQTDFLAWHVVTPDPWVAQVSTAKGIPVFADEGLGLNPALEEGIDHLIPRGAESVMIVPVDLPLATPGDLRDLTDTGVTSDVVLVPSHSDGGTNALLLSPPKVMPSRFGAGSLQAHVAQAQRLGLRCSILDLPRLSLDLDTEEDARRIVEKGTRSRSRTVDLLVELLGGG